jgi:copper chaperone CopZ
MQRVQFRVGGMSCGACEQRIVKALARVDGVAHSSADHRTGHVRVVFDTTRTSRDAVLWCIERAGYTVSP